MCRLETSIPHCCSGPRSAMKPSAATSAWAGRVDGLAVDVDLDRLQRRRRRISWVTWALVMISTSDSVTCWTVRSWARNASRRCTSAIDPGDAGEVERPVEGAVAAADDHDVLAGVRLEARARRTPCPRPSQPSPAGSGRGLNLPMPAVMSTAPARTSVPSSQADGDAVVVAGPGEPRCGRGGTPAWRWPPARPARRPATRPLTDGNPATSKICFSGYIAVIWPPSSGSESTTATRWPRKPA